MLARAAVTRKRSSNLRRVTFFLDAFVNEVGTAVTSRKNLRESLERLAEAEASALAAEFLAPMVRGGTVQVRIAGVVCRLRVSPSDFEGWGVFRPDSSRSARLVRPARLAERRRYLNLLPLFRVIVCGRDRDRWLAIPAHRADARFRIEGLVPVRLVEEPQLFDVLLTRFDGAQSWYDGPEPRRDPATAAYLREALARMVDPDQLHRPGLTAEERAAYLVNYAPRHQVELDIRRDRVEEQLRVALAHAGAAFRGYQEHGDVYRVAYVVDGRRQVSVVSRDDLSVQVAGICLSGQDRHFDLQSLVGVLREADSTGATVRIGHEGIPEGVYWDVHPPSP
jgi:hypothetical protein